jgi:hypothetical protein
MGAADPAAADAASLGAKLAEFVTLATANVL